MQEKSMRFANESDIELTFDGETIAASIKADSKGMTIMSAGKCSLMGSGFFRFVNRFHPLRAYGTENR